MKRKTRKKSQLRLNPRFGLVAALAVTCGFVMAAQAKVNLGLHVVGQAPQQPIALLAPGIPPKATPVPTATPKPPTPAPTPRPVITYHPRVTKVVPKVTAAPHSSVSHLVAVATPPSTSPSPMPSPSPSPSSSPSPSGGTGGTSAPYAYSSSNWSGYLASDATFTGVSGSWTVPHVSGNGSTTSGDATWVGIGGVTSSDLIQVGTEDMVSASGAVSTSAFYEMLPAVATDIPSMAVSAGDVMNASVTETSSGEWNILITDATTGKSFSTSVAYTSSNSTAEWIEEDPSYSDGTLVPFDTFGTVYFSGAVSLANGKNQDLTALGANPIYMLDSKGNIIATPSSIGSDGSSFSVSD